MFEYSAPADERLFLPRWTSEYWIHHSNANMWNLPEDIQKLVTQIRDVRLRRQRRGTQVSGFMFTLLQLLKFNEFPLSVYSGYAYFVKLGQGQQNIVAAMPDIAALGRSHKMVVIMEDPAEEACTYSNNWKENNLLHEMFLSIHRTASDNIAVTYPITAYAIRVVGTRITFYKATATKQYITESLSGTPTRAMKVLRHPPVGRGTYLANYDFCQYSERVSVLRCMEVIRRFISS